MAISKSAQVGGVSLLLFVVLWVWYSTAADYGYGALAGTCSIRLDGETSTLVLKKDQHFEQELTREGRVTRSKGSWRRIGEGGVVFSEEFLKVAGQDVRSDGQVDGQVEKSFGIVPSIVFNGGRIFRREMLH